MGKFGGTRQSPPFKPSKSYSDIAVCPRDGWPCPKTTNLPKPAPEVENMYEVTILCLANSRKPPSGRCIAGKVYKHGATNARWIRPVSARLSHEVSEEERRYEGGPKAQLLDIISVPLREPSPMGHQVENH